MRVPDNITYVLADLIMLALVIAIILSVVSWKEDRRKKWWQHKRDGK